MIWKYAKLPPHTKPVGNSFCCFKRHEDFSQKLFSKYLKFRDLLCKWSTTIDHPEQCQCDPAVNCLDSSSWAHCFPSIFNLSNQIVFFSIYSKFFLLLIIYYKALIYFNHAETSFVTLRICISVGEYFCKFKSSRGHS